MKLSRIEAFMRMAEEFAKESPDMQTKVGAVLISPTGRQVASGFNGFLRGAPDHLLPQIRPHKYEFIQHAERNLLYNCLDEGISTKGGTVICTLSPCKDCLRAVYQAGIETIIYKELYFDSEEFYTKLPDVKVTVEKIGKFTKLNLMKGSLRSDEEVAALLKDNHRDI